MQGRLVDSERFRKFMGLPVDMLAQARPEIIGAVIATEPDRRFTQTVALRSEDAAGESGAKQMPAKMRQTWRTRWPRCRT